MIINELLLDRPVESLDESVHLRCLGIGMEMGEVEPSQFFGKVFLELTPIVSQNKKEIIGMRERLTAERKELGRGLRGMTFGAPRKREPRINILKGNDVSAAAVYKPLHGVQGYEMTGIPRPEIPWFSQHFLTMRLLHLAEMRDLLREGSETSQIVDQVANGARPGRVKLALGAKRLKKRHELLSPEIRMYFTTPEAFQFPDNLERPEALAFSARDSREFIE